MFRKLRGYFAFAVLAATVFLSLPSPAHAQVVVKVNDVVNFRLGIQLQAWADWLQDPNSEGYSQNFLIRRIRFILAGQLAKNLSIFYQTDEPRAGNAGTNGDKNICSGTAASCPATGFITQDAYAEWKLAGDALMLDGGLFLVPTSRNGLTSTQSFLAYDIGTWALQGNGIEKGNGGRDYGFGLKGYVADDRLEYRLAAFDGNRNPTTPQPAPYGPAAGSRNSARIAGRVQYDFLDVEKGYVYAGTNRGTRKILALGGWGDGQGDYKAYGGDVFFDYPLVGKDALTAEFDYNHFEGGAKNPSLLKQNDVYTTAGWYFDAVKLQPFISYQKLNQTDDSKPPGDQERLSGGLNWYISNQNLKLSFLYEHIVPKNKPATARIKNTSHFSMQLQALYF
jgi:hypothetical protein